MIIYRNSYGGFKHSKVKIDMLRLRLVMIVLFAVSQISLGTCFGLDRPDFSTLKQIHREYYALIRTGILQIRYTRYNYQSEREISEIMRRHKVPVSAPDPNKILEYALLPEQKMDIYKNYAFNLSVQKYRVDKEPADPNLYKQPIYSRMGVRSIILSSKGTELHYSKETNHAVVGDYANTLARNIPAYLGVISQRHFEEFPENINVTIFQDSLDGRDVVVYELKGPGRNDKLRIYADPAVGYRYRLIEGFSDGKLVRKIIAKDYMVFDGIPFPTFHEDTIYRSDPNIPIKRAETIHVKLARFNQVIDPSVFKIQFTTDTIITDAILSVTFKPCADKSAELGVEDVLDRARRAAHK